MLAGEHGELSVEELGHDGCRRREYEHWGHGGGGGGHTPADDESANTGGTTTVVLLLATAPSGPHTSNIVTYTPGLARSA